MSTEAHVPDPSDEEFLDRLFELAVSLCEEGASPDADALMEGREHLRARVESLLRTARLVTPVRSQALPSVRGFTLLGEIGRGGMGAVYLARQEALGGRRVALKVLPAAAGLSARARERFLVEARAIAGLRHSNVVTIHDVVAEEGIHAYAMEWVDGASLGGLLEFLRSKGEGTSDTTDMVQPKLDDARVFLDGPELPGPTYPIFVCRIGIAIARALASLHKAGLVHRDVKPSNILLRKDGTPLLSDFGLVHESASDLTHSGQFVGTLAYASPEQIGGNPESLDARTDVYALGVTLYQALSLHLPFDGRRRRARRVDNPTAMLRMIERGRAAPLRTWNRRLPRDLETILSKAIDPEPARRYTSADEVADDLERMLSLQPIRARASGWLSRGVRFLRRNRAAAFGIGAGSVTSLILAAALVVYIFIVPRWIDEHVREARLALLDPVQANAMFNSEFFGAPVKSMSQRVPGAALERAMEHYDVALRWAPFHSALRAEREVVAAARRTTADQVAPPGADPVDVRSAGLLAYLRGDIELALGYWERFEAGRDLMTAPDPLVEAALGFLYLVREEHSRAYPRLREACQSFPDVAFLTTYLADAAVHCGDLDAAEGLLSAARTMPRPDPVGSRGRVLADLRAAQGRDAEAEGLYRAAAVVSPAGLHYARFLESRGRREEALSVYMLLASSVRCARVQGQCAAAMERWWDGLSEAQRTREIEVALDMGSDGLHSLVARSRLVADADSMDGSLGGRTQQPTPGSSRPSVFFATLSTRSSSPALQSRSLVDLARTLEVHDMTRWNEIPRYPRPLKVLQLWAWRSPWPTQLSSCVSRLASWLPRFPASTAAVVIAGAGALHAQDCPGAPCFQGLGDLPGGTYFSFANCISSDGTTVGGGSSTALSLGEPRNNEAFIWRADTGMVYLGDIPGNGEMGETLGLTADGSVAVGWSSSALSVDPHYGYPEAFRWTQAGGMVALGDVEGSVLMSVAAGIPDDGSFIAGRGVGTSPFGSAWRSITWTSSNGWVVQGGSSTRQSYFFRPSRNGQWIAGKQDPDFSHVDLTRWSESLGMETLFTVGAGIDGGSTAVSDDGVVTGVFGSASGYDSFVWTENSGFQLLDALPGGAHFDYASGILRDGTLIVGTSQSSAVLWDETRAVHRLDDFLTAAGVVVPPGWTLTDAHDIVKNCYVVTVCGEGLNPSGNTEAWVARYLTTTAEPPIAIAGTDQSVSEVSLVTLDGSSSSIPCGSPSYTWTQLAGHPITLNLVDPARPMFTSPGVPAGGETLTFQLVVSDGQQQGGPDVVNVTVTNVNHAPVAFAGDDQAVAEGSPVELDGSNSFDEDSDVLDYRWVQLEGTPVGLDLTDPVRPAFMAPFVGPSGDVLVFELTVSDTFDSASDTIEVAVENVNHAPVANAGQDQTRAEGALVALTASASGDPDGDALTFDWAQIGGPAVALSDASSATPNFTAPQVPSVGALIAFRVTVNDGYGGIAADDVEITVQDANSPPACELARPSVGELWPPNHKMSAVSILGVTDPENDALAITILAVTQDEPIHGLGDGDTSPDAVIQGGTVLLRAERSGSGNGRVYRVTFQADDGHGGVCIGQVNVCVPHSKGKNALTCVDDGQIYSSLGH